MLRSLFYGVRSIKFHISHIGSIERVALVPAERQANGERKHPCD